MKHITRLLGMMLFAAGFTVQAGAQPADNALTPTTPPPLHAPANNPAKLEKEILKLGAVITGCEMNDQCILMMLGELTKSDPNPAYKEYLKRAELQKDLIEKNVAMCNTEAIRAFKKETSQCLAAGFDVMGKNISVAGDLHQKLEKQMEECLNTRMLTLANNGNLYAQLTMAQRALERNDMKTYKYWYAMVKGQGNSPDMPIVQPCAEGIDFSLKNFIETAKTIIPLAK